MHCIKKQISEQTVSDNKTKLFIAHLIIIITYVLFGNLINGNFIR